MNKGLVFLLLFIIAACKIPDDKNILGKWQSDDVWYEYLENKTYNSGRAHLTMIRGFKYTLDIEKKELTMYTDDPNQTYYLQYRFNGNDTLLLNNVLNSTPHFESFSRIKK